MVGFHDLLMEFDRGPESALEATVGTFGSFPIVRLQKQQLDPNMSGMIWNGRGAGSGQVICLRMH